MVYGVSRCGFVHLELQGLQSLGRGHFLNPLTFSISFALRSSRLRKLRKEVNSHFRGSSSNKRAIRPSNSIAFRTGVTFNNPQGNGWIDVDGSFVQLEAGHQGRVYAVDPDNVLYYRSGICVNHPTGSSWKQVKSLLVDRVAVGDNSLFVIAKNGSVFTST